MPKRRFYKKSNRYRKRFKRFGYRSKRFYRKYKKWGKRQIVSIKRPSVIPDGIWVTLKYVDLLNFTTGFNQVDYPYSGNGVYDPYTLTGGHQPRGFDQWCAAASFYKDYRVPYSSVKIRGSDSSFDGEPIQYYIYPTTEAVFAPATADHAAVAELPYFHSRYPDINANTSSRVVRMKHRMSAKKMWGESYDKTDTSFIGNYATNPTTMWYWHIGALNMTGDGIAGFIQVEITYRVYFFNRNTISLDEL